MDPFAIVPDAGGGYNCNGVNFKNRGHAVSYAKGKVRRAREADAAKLGEQHGRHPGAQMVPPYWPGYAHAEPVAIAYVQAFCRTRALLVNQVTEDFAESAEG